MQKMTIIGHLGQDAEIRKGKNGNEFVKFSVASTVQKKNSDEKETLWVDVISGQTSLKEHLTKGKQVYVTGNVSISVYNDKPQVTISNPDIQLL